MATLVCAISVKSAEISIVSVAPRCTPPIPPVANILIPTIEAIRMVAATVVAPGNFFAITYGMSLRLTFQTPGVCPK